MLHCRTMQSSCFGKLHCGLHRLSPWLPRSFQKRKIQRPNTIKPRWKRKRGSLSQNSFDCGKFRRRVLRLQMLPRLRILQRKRRALTWPRDLGPLPSPLWPQINVVCLEMSQYIRDIRQCRHFLVWLPHQQRRHASIQDARRRFCRERLLRYSRLSQERATFHPARKRQTRRTAHIDKSLDIMPHRGHDKQHEFVHARPAVCRAWILRVFLVCTRRRSLVFQRCLRSQWRGVSVHKA